jgi:colanic acid biosynthesis glycosyl transferase WcaI
VRVIFLNRFYWPDEPATAQLLTDLAGALTARGHAVTVIAGRPADRTVPSAETRAGVGILRVRGTHWGRNHLAGRAVDFITFLLAACWRLAWTAQRGDVVVAMTDPPLLGVIAWPVARLKGARCLHWVQDIYPEIAMALSTNPLIQGMGALLRPFRNFVWRHSSGCVALGDDMAAFIARAGVPAGKITVIPNWAPAGLEQQPPEAADTLRKAWKLQDRFVVAYSGNLGRVHDLSPVLAVASTLRDEPGISFVFIGGGAQRAALERFVTAQRLTNVRFQPAQPRDRLAVTLALGDVHLVTLHAGCEALVFPSKLYGIAAVGRPMLAIGPRNCELARLVTRRGLGFAFARDEIPAMADTLRQLAADPARCASLGAAAAEFSRTEGRLAHGAAAWADLLNREAAC